MDRVRDKLILDKEKSPLVSVIIVNFNGKDVIGKCLESVFATIYPYFEVIVVDNGSTDGSVEMVQEKYSIRLIKNGCNLGKCAGDNIGIRNSLGEYVVLLNPDTVVSPNWLQELVREAINSEACFCQPKILMLDNPETINSTGITIHFAGFGILRGNGEKDVGQYNNDKEIASIHSACVLISKKAIQDIKLLDENFFAYNDDTDWGWRARILGWKITYVPSAIVYHKWGQSSGLNPDKFYYLERNRLIMILTNYSRRSITLLLPLFLFTEIAVIGYALIRDFIHEKIKSYADLIRLRNYIRKRRELIQIRRRVSDEVLFNNFTHEIKHIFFGKLMLPINAIYKYLCRLLTS